MSAIASLSSSEKGELSRGHLYTRLTILITASIIVCATMIIRYSNWNEGSFMAGISSLVEVTVNALLPYMISAVVASITALAVLAILPGMKETEPVMKITERLLALRSGDLASRVNIRGEGQLRVIGYELNRAIKTVHNQVSTLKLLNQQQWKTLCDIRGAVESGDSQQALQHIEEMEKNWERLAEVEKTLLT
jgi:hypothetical protein